MNKINISELSDTKLNRAMIWLYMCHLDGFLSENFNAGLEEQSSNGCICDDESRVEVNLG